MSDYFKTLPTDVLTDIITRLPIKTLIRCTSLCKSWYYLITNPSFITKHLNRSNNRELLLVRWYTDFDRREHYALSFDDDTFSEYANLEFPLTSSSSNRFFRIIGSCNGLICLADTQYIDMGNLFLWNPSIGKVLRLPPLGISPESSTSGFGFDSMANDYKVVRFASKQEIRQETHIFSVSTGTWRTISHAALPGITFKEWAPQAFLEGAAHWLGYSDELGYLIGYFHMGRENFGAIMLEDVISDQLREACEELYCVANFQESSALIFFTNDLIKKEVTCSIWVMKEYGNSQSWTKQFSIFMVAPAKTLGVTRKGELLLSTTDGNLVAHDPKTGRSTSLLTRGTSSIFEIHSLSAYAYTESLVLLGNIRGY